MINPLTEDLISFFWLFVISTVYLSTFGFLSLYIQSDYMLWTFGLFLAFFITRVITYILEVLMNRFLVSYDNEIYFIIVLF